MSMVIAAHPENVPLHEDSDGVVRVSGTRVTLESVLDAFHSGATAEEIAARFDVLPLADIYSTIGFYLRHTDEVAAYLKRREDAARQTREQASSHIATGDIRSRLSRRRAMGA